MTIHDSDVHIYTEGLIHMSVCAPSAMAGDEVAAAVNRKRPTGLSHGWKISDKKTFNGGEPMPSPCNKNGERTHWLVDC